jgi:hypothetical protein
MLATSGFAQTSPADQSEHPAQAAPPAPPPEQTAPPDVQSGHGLIVGIVVSVSTETFVVRTEDNQFHLFVYDRGLVRPKGFASGAHVRIEYTGSGESGVGLATRVTILDESGATTEVPPPPIDLRETQREIERLARRWQFGFRVGAGLDPELFLVGVHTNIRLGRELSFRPNAEFAFGELTDMVAINLEAAYRLPISLQEGRWSVYVGAGPGLNFIHQGIGTRDISFSNFNYETGMNVLGGVRFRRGMFTEVKASVWAHGVPTLRLLFGYTF